MKHVFIATRKGWGQEKDVIYFDEEEYTKEEAEAEFVEKEGWTEKSGKMYPYTYYEYDGEEYHDYSYYGLCDEADMPR